MFAGVWTAEHSSHHGWSGSYFAGCVGQAWLQCRLYLVASSSGSGAVQALVHKAAQAHVVADNVQHAHHLAEDQHPAAGVSVSGASKAAAHQSGNQILQCTAAAQTLSGQWPTTCSITSAVSSSTSPAQPSPENLLLDQSPSCRLGW